MSGVNFDIGALKRHVDDINNFIYNDSVNKIVCKYDENVLTLTYGTDQQQINFDMGDVYRNMIILHYIIGRINNFVTVDGGDWTSISRSVTKYKDKIKPASNSS